MNKGDHRILSNLMQALVQEKNNTREFLSMAAQYLDIDVPNYEDIKDLHDRHPDLIIPVYYRDCKVCNAKISNISQSHYMILDDLWRSAGFTFSDIACIQCFEKTLGREVTVKDLTDAPINDALRWALSKVVT